MLNSTPIFPRRAGGKPTSARAAAELAADLALCNWIENQWRTHGFAFGARGWAYVLEGVGSLTKDEFDASEKWLAKVRKEGLLDPDAVADDDSRAGEFIESLDPNDPDIAAAAARDFARYSLDHYTPVSRWDGLGTYVEILVEKVDLKVLFRDVCERYGVTLINGKGSADLNLRRRMLQRFRDQHAAGRECVLLYCGDHDPAGLRISDVLKRNLIDCGDVRDVAWNPSPVRVERFGLSAAQIARIGLPWINNLLTASGKDLAADGKTSGKPKHPDHDLSYVQDYLAAHGARKVEANALAAHPVDAQAMVEAAINQYVPAEWPAQHEARLAPYRDAARKAFRRLILINGI